LEVGARTAETKMEIEEHRRNFYENERQQERG
jgi:hypothetical protein